MVKSFFISFVVVLLIAATPILSYLLFVRLYDMILPEETASIPTWPTSTTVPTVTPTFIHTPATPPTLPTLPTLPTPTLKPPIPEITPKPTETPVADTDTCSNLRVLIDKMHALPESYVPPDLVTLASYGMNASGGALGRNIMMADLQRLYSDSLKAGLNLIAVSTYRSYAHQASIYSAYIQLYGEEQANRFSARPGHSEHQLGTTLDFTTPAVNNELVAEFDTTPEGQWLLAHAHQYGFSLSYPEGHEGDTGYMYEPWHYRYIGIDSATTVHNSGILLHTYLTQTGILPHC